MLTEQPIKMMSTNDDKVTDKNEATQRGEAEANSKVDENDEAARTTVINEKANVVDKEDTRPPQSMKMSTAPNDNFKGRVHLWFRIAPTYPIVGPLPPHFQRWYCVLIGECDQDRYIERAGDQ